MPRIYVEENQPVPPVTQASRSSELRRALMDLPAGEPKCVTLFPDGEDTVAKLRNRVSGVVNALRKQQGVQFVTRTAMATPSGESEDRACVRVWKQGAADPTKPKRAQAASKPAPEPKVADEPKTDEPASPDGEKKYTPAPQETAPEGWGAALRESDDEGNVLDDL